MKIPRTPRQYPVPKAIRAAFVSDTTTLDEMELIAARPGEAGAWAAKVIARENDKLLNYMLGDDTLLPRGVLASGEDVEVVRTLVNAKGEVWTGTKWTQPVEEIGETVMLSEPEVAFVARALAEGADGAVLHPAIPVAFLTAAVEASGGEGVEDLPQGAVTVAITDSLDTSAILELIAVAPGPKVYRRHDGSWHEDPAWVDVLKSIEPPPMVKIEEAQVASIASQVDKATQGEVFKPLKHEEAQGYRAKRGLAASSYLEELKREGDQFAVDYTLSLVAVAGQNLTPKDWANTERLRRYWLYGKGAAKIRWFTPGAWRRCYRHLRKYMGPMAKGYCTNLSQRLGGQGVATHVGDRR